MYEVERIPVKGVEAIVSSMSIPLPTVSRRDRVQVLDRSAHLYAEIQPAPWSPHCQDKLKQAVASGVLRLVVGDYTEPGVSAKEGLCANAALVDIDTVTGRVQAISSVVGLPPIAVYEGRGVAYLSSPGLPLRAPLSEVDIEGVADTLRWGHPLDGRTLFNHLRIVPARTRVSLEANREVYFERIQPTSTSPSLLRSRGPVEAQAGALLQAASRLPTTDAFLSLSGGLDSRTALVALLQSGRTVRCVSMAGSPFTLDFRLARRFCEAHGLAHQVIEFGDDYARRLPDLVMQSAALTGGVACLSQTIDLYLYSQVEGRSHTRISGHLGNQVGRGGVESISAARLTDRIFSQDLRLVLDKRPVEPWFVSRMARLGFASVLFEQEVHYWSIANYMLGSSCALQLSPYADVTLIEMAKAAISGDPRFHNPTNTSIRNRDIRHRLCGPPLARSFQRAVLMRYDQAGPNIPMNWGWRARGGWSVRWAPAAVRTAADAVACKLGRQRKSLRILTQLSRALGRPSTLVPWPELLRSRLRAFTCDTLLSRNAADSGLFEVTALRRALDDHFCYRADHHSTICRALEIAIGLVSAKTRAAAAVEETGGGGHGGHG
jgi:hypothetical protein